MFGDVVEVESVELVGQLQDVQRQTRAEHRIVDTVVDQPLPPHILVHCRAIDVGVRPPLLNGIGEGLRGDELVRDTGRGELCSRPRQ
ncbi:MAG: hypothetical protein U5N21_23825 [Rhodococcus sp. (in: high G+C Gram-positive bacteria)]|nr:hypothetical protein [Rhodococcus sp. (in: high G+C Gram-positive bacteria)]